ncbi:MAG: hypothetical protein DBY14_03190 [Escherichia coli]|nr:MAG: hypothetical protein DBY14_03190 [Escherichia coli]
MPTIHLCESLNRYIAIHTYEYEKPEEEAISAALLRAFFVCSLPAYYAIHRKFSIPCKFCAVLP